MLEFEALTESQVARMSALATSIVREHFDPLIGKEQNDYMLALFQSEPSIRNQMASYQYYFVKGQEKDIGFLSMKEEKEYLYLSKFYLCKEKRGQGLAYEMLDFVINTAQKLSLKRIRLNVNRHNCAVQAYRKMGFTIVKEEVNDIGHGYVMDDYVMVYMLGI